MSSGSLLCQASSSPYPRQWSDLFSSFEQNSAKISGRESKDVKSILQVILVSPNGRLWPYPADASSTKRRDLAR